MRAITIAPPRNSPTKSVDKSTREGLSVKNLSLSYGSYSGKDVVRTILSDLELSVPVGQTLALLGPSGCGKTSLLRAIAGLEIPICGSVGLGDDVLFDSAQPLKPSINIKPEHRRLGMVFQDLALFPHLSVGKNVSYGLNNLRTHSSSKAQLVAEALELVQLPNFENRRISTLSGGQLQRVALARALAPKPRALLLDEPFSSLDEPTRVELRNHLHLLLSELETTAIFVTHDQEEAFIMGDQVAIMNSSGQIEQQGNPMELYTRPKSPWIADFVGHSNLVKGKVEKNEAGKVVAKTLLGDIPLLPSSPSEGASVDVLIHPEDFVFVDSTTKSSNSLELEISVVEYYGHDTIFVLTDPTGTLTELTETGQVWVRGVDHNNKFARGDKVNLKFVGADALCF